MKKWLSLLILIMISCSKEKGNDEGNCVDESLVDSTSFCIEIYDPVCGCNGITYPNSCYASTLNGVKSFTKGTCG